MINNHEELIRDLTSRCKAIVGKTFSFKKKINPPLVHYVLEGTDEAENYKNCSPDLIKVLHWFDDFWLFMEVRIIAIADQKSHKHKSTTNQISISISVYHDNNSSKIQLFRAEWDDYSDEHSKHHPQPHWHITFNNQDNSSFAQFVKEYDDDFASLLESKNESRLNIKDIHFAMSSSWHLEKEFPNQIDDSTKIVKWVVGLLNHIETELKYIAC